MSVQKGKINDKESGFHINIRLYDTAQELQRGTHTKGIHGLYRPNSIVVYPKRKVKPMLGTLSLCRDNLNIGIVAHEVYHATMDYANKRYNVNSVKTDNCERQEELAYFHGWIVIEINRWLHKIGGWKK